MLRAIIEGWRSGDLAKEAEEHTRKLFRLGEELYTESYLALLHQEEIANDLRVRFAELKRLAGEIRRKLAEHLNVSDREDIRRDLLVFGIVDELELAGDSARVIFQLTGLLDTPLSGFPTCDRLQVLAPRVKSLFARSERALLDTDKEDGRKVLEEHRDINRVCEGILLEMMAEGASGSAEAVTAILAVRSFRRISACMDKIVSSAMGNHLRPARSPEMLRVLPGLP